ncbi:MAG: hypothetical protein ACREDR_02295 [Blastocatellia bacterium]
MAGRQNAANCLQRDSVAPLQQGKPETMGPPVYLDPDPSELSDEQAIAASKSFVGTPWENLSDRKGLLLTPETAEGQLYVACLNLRFILPIAHSPSCCGLPARKAVSASLRALDLKPDYAEAYVTLTEGYLLLRQWDDAVAAAQEALHLRPDWPSSYCLLTEAYMKLGRYDYALNAAEREQTLRQAITSGRSNKGFEGPVPFHWDDRDLWRIAKIHEHQQS